MKQQIISLLERAKENGTTIGDVLAEVREMRPVCLTCDDHGAVGSILDTVPCPDCSQHAETKLEWITTPDIRDVPDCVLTPSGIALKQSQISAQDGRTQVDNDLVSSLLRIAEVAPASECEILQAAAAALASAPVAGEAIQKAKHDTANAETERERVMALAYWLDQQTFEPGMLSCAAATLRAMFDRDAVNELVAAEYNRWIRAHAAGQSYDTFLIAELAAQQGEGGGV